MTASHACCAECQQFTDCHFVLWRGRYSNGHRGKTEHQPICASCIDDLIGWNDLTPEECDFFGKDYFVNGWHAAGLLAASQP